MLAIRRKAWRENAHAYPSVKHEHQTWTYPSPTPRHDCSQWDRAISAALAVRERGRREEKHTRHLVVSPFKEWDSSDLSIRPNSSIEHQHFSPNRNSPPFPRPSLLRSFFSSFFLLLYLSHSPLARPVYAKQRRTHGRKYIYIYIYTNCVSPWPSSKHCLTLTLATRQRATKSRCTSSSFSSSTWIRRTITKRVTFFFFTVPKLKPLSNDTDRNTRILSNDHCASSSRRKQRNHRARTAIMWLGAGGHAPAMILRSKLFVPRL